MWELIHGDKRERSEVEFANHNDLMLVNTFGQHEASRRWIWHSPNGEYKIT